MDNTNTNTITRPNGSRYAYDADFDVYRRIPDPEELTHTSQYGWIYVCAVLVIISAVITMVER
jgi:hypothetical protein